MNVRNNNRNIPPAQTAPAQNAIVAANPKLMTAFAAQYGIDANKMVGILRATAFKANPPATDEEIASLVVVAKIYHLNPFLKEIYAFRGQLGIVPIVGVDGWIRIVESQPMYIGEEMKSGFDETIGPNGKPLGFYYECFMHRSDRKFPTSRRQYYEENYRKTNNWDTMPTRMLQHRAYIQSARATFGLGGIYDEDEGQRIADMTDVTPRKEGMKPATRPPRELPPQAQPFIEHDPPTTPEFQHLGEAETVNLGTGEIKQESRKPIASEPPDFGDEEEAGVRG
jgi:phage recombination protein Bet